MSLDEFKYIFWWEWLHRFFARLIGIIFILPFLYFWLKNHISRKLFFTLTVVFVFGIFQALVGWWMVKSGLIDNPYVSQYRLTFHLSNALIIFCILFWTTLTSFFEKKDSREVNTTINNLFHIGLFFLFITIISGGFMAGTNAGQSFNTFPLMSSEFIPEGYYFNEYGWLNSFENTVAINFNHRWLASFTFLLICAFHLYLLISKKYKGDNFSSILVIIIISLQFFLGILTLINNVPILFASLHQTNSVLLLASMLFAYHRHKYKKR
jgi:cytochrome c oxidase assembly protein subunit 15